MPSSNLEHRTPRIGTLYCLKKKMRKKCPFIIGRLQIDIGTYFSVPKLNLKDRKVAGSYRCQLCMLKKGHKGSNIIVIVYISG